MLLAFLEVIAPFMDFRNTPFSSTDHKFRNVFKQVFFIFLNSNSALVYFLWKAGLPIPTLKGFHSFTSAVV